MSGSSKKNLPIKIDDSKEISKDFSNMWDLFHTEVRKMEEKMDRFRSQMMKWETDFFGSTFTGMESLSNETEKGTISDFESPLSRDNGNGKDLKLRFDVGGYSPEEIFVETVDRNLKIYAKHEEKSDTRSVYREYNQQFLLPKGFNPETITTSLSKDGVLTVNVPMLSITDGGEAKRSIKPN